MTGILGSNVILTDPLLINEMRAVYKPTIQLSTYINGLTFAGLKIDLLTPGGPEIIGKNLFTLGFYDKNNQQAAQRLYP